MKRGELYRVFRGSKIDTKDFRVFVIISRQALINSKFSTVICAPVYSRNDGLSTQVELSLEEGLKNKSAVFCDELISIEKSKLTNYVGTLPEAKLAQLNDSLKIALEIES